VDALHFARLETAIGSWYQRTYQVFQSPGYVWCCRAHPRARKSSRSMGGRIGASASPTRADLSEHGPPDRSTGEQLVVGVKVLDRSVYTLDPVQPFDDKLFHRGRSEDVHQTVDGVAADAAAHRAG